MPISEKQLRCQFFTTGDDLRAKFRDFVSPFPIKIVRYGFLNQPTIDSFDSLLDIPNLGISMHGDKIRDDQYWFVKRDADLELKKIGSSTENSAYTINPVGVGLVQFSPGGLYNQQCMIAGECAVRSADPDILLLYAQLAKFIQRGSQSVNAFWLGPEAVKLFRGSMRFTIGAQSTHTLVDDKGVLK
jgi:hypothetical protein